VRRSRKPNLLKLPLISKLRQKRFKKLSPWLKLKKEKRALAKAETLK
jgi:hypothetical protein